MSSWRQAGKRLEILKEIAPQVSKVAVLLYPQVPGYVNWLRQVEAAGPALSVEVTATRVHNANEIEHAITNFASQGGGGLVVLPSPITNGNYGLIAELAARYRLPAVYPYRFYVSSGAGLASYGADTIDWYRQAGSYVARILSGEKPADLPVQAPTKFQLVINLKTAKALGLTIPQSLLVRADEVIE